MSVDRPPTAAELGAKARSAPRRLARRLLEAALLLRALWRDPAVPGWAKALILGALAYFLCPLDAVPDVLPGGLADDLAAMAAVLSALASLIQPRHRREAAQAADAWLNRNPDSPEETP